MTSIFGTDPHVGVRYIEDITYTARTVTKSTSFWNALLPDATLLSDAEIPAAQAALVAQAGTDTFNTTQWSTAVTIRPLDSLMVPVRYLGYQGTGAVAPIQKPLQRLLQEDGVPIPDGYTPQADSDASAVFYQPDWVSADGTMHGRLYELWRLKPCTPAQATDPVTGIVYDWCTYEGGRMTGVAESPGHWRDRYNSATYSTLPTVVSKRDTYEHRDWGSTAAKLPLAEGIITVEDVESGSIDHAISFASQPAYIRSGYRWPAQAYDGSGGTAALQEGMRLRLPVSFDVIGAGLKPLATMVALAAQRYGLVLVDRAGALSFRGEPGVEGYYVGPRANELDGFPWGQLQVLATGSDNTPNPV